MSERKRRRKRGRGKRGQEKRQPASNPTCGEGTGPPQKPQLVAAYEMEPEGEGAAWLHAVEERHDGSR